MRIVIDATTLLLPSAGVKNYIHYWLLSLLEMTQAQNGGDLILTYPPGTRIATVIDHQRPTVGALETWLRLQWVNLSNVRGAPLLDWLVRDANIFHCSQHTANLPRRTRATATIFDLSCWTTPGAHTPANIAATRRYGERILKPCDGLIAISAHTRNDARSILGIPEERIRVIYPGVAEAFFQVTPEVAQKARAKYRLDVPYTLFVGCIEPRKNVANMILGHMRMSESLRRDVQLVVAGPFGWASDDVRDMLREGCKSVRYLGYVPEADLPGVVGGAVALIYPSYYEGFGFPVAQAMAAGVPVITSNRSCLPEIVGDAGLLVDPDDIDELSGAMEHILACPELRTAMAERGKERATMFRWAACAAQSLQFFHDL